MRQKDKIVTGFGVLILVVLLLNTYMLSGINHSLATLTGDGLDGGSDEVKEVVKEQPSVPSEPSRVQVGVDDDSVKGDSDAPVTIVEFSDYECPFCGKFASQTLPQIMKEYVDTGKVKMVFRDFPLGFHANAQKAGEAAECAGEQGKYWEMHDKLFENQQALGVANLKGYAADLGLDTGEFDECLDSGAMAQEVKDDFDDGRLAGVSGTPAFFINGNKLVGAQPFANFKQIIDSELN